MLVFSDFHHASLLQSLILLFEKRLGYSVFRPIGLDWYDQGYWKIYDHPDTAKQYLSLDQLYKPVDGTPPLNQIIEQGKGIYLCNDIGEGIPNKAIDFEKFKETKFDILIASIPQHIEPFRELITKYQPQAKLIFQIGNAWNIDSYQAYLLDGIMASAKIPLQSTVLGYNGKPLPIIEYHQEFDLDIFHYEPPKKDKKIYSFINCLNTVDIYKKDWELFLELERLMPDWEFKSFGGQTRDGAIGPVSNLADKMREATFIYQVKSMGDGYGHIIHNATAVGRAMITRFADYQGKLAEILIDDGTSILVDRKSPQQIADEINSKHVEQIEAMGRLGNAIFKRASNFNIEEQEIRLFLDNLK